MFPLRVYHALLYLYPSAFRHEYGGEMALAFADELREARQARQWWRETALFISNSADVIFTAPQEHFHVIHQDLRYAMRQLAAYPGFAAVAVLSLALGIGANTAIFSLLNSVLLKTLPVRDPRGLVMLTDPGRSGVSIGSQGGERGLLTYAEFRMMQDSVDGFDGVMASQSSLSELQGSVDGGGMEEIRVRTVSNSYFDVLGVSAHRGRVWSGPESDVPAAEPEAVLSYEFWQRRFAGTDAAIGKRIRIRGGTFTVVGVMPRWFFGETVGQRPDAWLPLHAQGILLPRREWLREPPGLVEKTMWLHVMARVRPGYSPNEAAAQANVVFQRNLETFYSSRLEGQMARDFLDQRLKIQPAAAGASSLRTQFSEPLLVLLAAAGMVLLIACANLGNILLARVTARNRELSIRLALGASRGRLVRQLMTESLALAVAGGIVGIGAGLLLRTGLMMLVPANVELPLSPDWRLVGFAFGLTILAGVLMGLLPVLRLFSVGVRSGLHENGRGNASSARSRRTGRFVVIGQLAMSLPLLVGAGMLLLTLYNLQRADLGFQRDHLVMTSLDLSSAGYEGARVIPAVEQVQARLLEIPGVQSVSYSANGVLTSSDSGDRIDVEGYQPADGEPYGSAYDTVGPGYFSHLGIPMLRGREITERDTAASMRVCVINETFAKEYFSGREPIGMHVTQIFGNDRNTYQIVGVVRDVKTRGVRQEMASRFYLPATQPVGELNRVRVLIRTGGNPEAMVNAVSQSMRQMNPDFANAWVTTADSLLQEQLGQDRLLARLSLAFGGVALLLAMIGLYGVLSHEVGRRTREVGVRKALGARPADIYHLVLRETALLLVIGLAVGVAVTTAALRLISSRLYGLEATDPLMYAVAASVLAIVAMAASGLPARRAARVDPLVALRHE